MKKSTWTTLGRWAVLLWSAVAAAVLGADLLVGSGTAMIITDVVNLAMALVVTSWVWQWVKVSFGVHLIAACIILIPSLVISFIDQGFWLTIGFMTLGYLLGNLCESRSWVRRLLRKAIEPVQQRLRRDSANALEELYELPAYEREEDSGR